MKATNVLINLPKGVKGVANTPTEETTDNTPNVADLARWIDLQLSTIIDGVSAGYTLGNYNSVWIDKGSTVFNVSLANGETVEIDSDNYNTAEEIATAIISTLKNTPSAMNANETTELGYNAATRSAMIDAARAFLVLADELNEQVSAYIDGSDKPEAEAAYNAVKDAEAVFLRYYCAYWDEPRRRPCLGYELAESSLPEDDEYFNGAA